MKRPETRYLGLPTRPIQSIAMSMSLVSWGCHRIEVHHICIDISYGAFRFAFQVMLEGWTDRVYLGRCHMYMSSEKGLKSVFQGGGEREVRVNRGSGAGRLTLTSSG